MSEVCQFPATCRAGARFLDAKNKGRDPICKNWSRRLLETFSTGWEVHLLELKVVVRLSTLQHVREMALLILLLTSVKHGGVYPGPVGREIRTPAAKGHARTLLEWHYSSWNLGLRLMTESTSLKRLKVGPQRGGRLVGPIAEFRFKKQTARIWVSFPSVRELLARCIFCAKPAFYHAYARCVELARFACLFLPFLGQKKTAISPLLLACLLLALELPRGCWGCWGCWRLSQCAGCWGCRGCWGC